MSEIYVKAAATLHELFAQRKEIAAQAGKRLRKTGRNAKKSMRNRWERAQGYLLSALIGSILTLLAVNGYAGTLDSIHDPEAEDSEAEQQRVLTVAETVAAAKQDNEARELARLLYCMVPTHSREDQERVCWCAINRAESSLYPDSIAGVVQQPSQWVGYSADAPVIQQYYDVAASVLAAWHGGDPRPLTPDFLWLDWSKTDVELRNSFEITKETRYW